MSPTMQATIEELFKQADLAIDEAKAQKLAFLVQYLAKWNKALNLTAIKSEDEMLILHIMDSAIISPLLIGNNIADVGTGAGFPGLVLAILNEDKNFTLIDSIAKKISFVRNAVAELKLTNVQVINDRCENIKLENGFDMIVSRAFAPLERMVNWCLPLLAEQGLFLAMKAKLEDDEVNQVPKSVTIDRIIKLHVPKLDAIRQAVLIKRKESKDV